MAAFLQTLLWVGLIVWALLRFEKVIGALFGAVTKRIEDGDELAGPGGFRLGVRQTPAEEQRDRLQEEAQEVVRNVAAEESQPAAPAGQTGLPEHAEQSPVSPPNGNSVKMTLEAAVRDVSDAHTLGLKWLGMMTDGQVLPDVKVGDVAFDGLLKHSDGKPRSLVMVKLVNSTSQMVDIGEQVKRWSNTKLSDDLYRRLPISVVLVKSDRVSSRTLRDYIRRDVGLSGIRWYEIELPQLRSMYGLEFE